MPSVTALVKATENRGNEVRYHGFFSRGNGSNSLLS